jgi:hypothetical protein
LLTSPSLGEEDRHELVHPRIREEQFGESGISELLGTMVCCFCRKKSR